VQGIKVIPPNEIPEIDIGKIYIASTSSPNRIVDYLHLELSVPLDKIDISFVVFSLARNKFVKSFAHLIYGKGLNGNVAECGVSIGEFALEINGAFPDRKLYLFDTFTGFDERDLRIEVERGFSNISGTHFFLDNAEEVVMRKLPHKENAILCKGWFPQSAQSVDDNFIFVNVDFDLYAPILSALKFFWYKMVRGGVILVHDYFSEEWSPDNAYKGARIAVDEFCAVNNIYVMPIGDELSVALLKY
jgi:hypothetical protein